MIGDGIGRKPVDPDRADQRSVCTEPRREPAIPVFVDAIYFAQLFYRIKATQQVPVFNDPACKTASDTRYFFQDQRIGCIEFDKGSSREFGRSRREVRSRSFGKCFFRSRSGWGMGLGSARYFAMTSFPFVGRAAGGCRGGRGRGYGGCRAPIRAYPVVLPVTCTLPLGLLRRAGGP